MKQTRMKSFVEQSERHYVSVPRHHLWSRIYIILRVFVFHIYVVYVRVCMYYFHVFARVWSLCMCLGVLRYSCLLSCFLTRALPLSLRSFTLLSHSLSSYSLVLSRFSRALCRIYARTSRSFPPAFLYLLPNIPRVLLPLSLSLNVSISNFYTMRNCTRL